MLSCLDYHEATSYARGEIGGHRLDWTNQPDLFKSYGLEIVELPRDIVLPDISLGELVGAPEPDLGRDGLMDKTCLSRVLFATSGLTAVSRQVNGRFFFRSAASAGALYPCETYVAVGEMEGLEPGLYHYSVAQHGLETLKSGACIDPIVDALVPSPRSTLTVAFLFTVIFFRSAWKYRERAYRYHLLDTGHVLENWSLALRAHGFRSEISCDFHDEALNDFLALDTSREVLLAVGCVPGERAEGEKVKPEATVPAFELRAKSRVAEREVDYPLVRRIHGAGFAIKPLDAPPPPDMGVYASDVDTWREIGYAADSPPGRSYAETVVSRRSRRNFVRKPLSCEIVTAVLRGLCNARLAGEGAGAEASARLSIGLVVGEQVEDYEPGLYHLDRAGRRMSTLLSGDVSVRHLAAICLDQQWLAAAAMHVLFLCNLADLERRMGPRSYRHALMSAGLLGERLYLHATALGLGCCGIGAFYDGEAADRLKLNAQSRLLYLVALGPVKSGGEGL